MITESDDNAKYPSPPVYPKNWATQYDDAPYADEWGIPYEQDLDSYDAPYADEWGIPYEPEQHFEPDCGQHYFEPVTACYTPHEPTQAVSQKPTMTEYLASLDQWPAWDSVPVQPRPITTSAQLKAMRVKERKIELKEGQWASDVLTFRQIQNNTFEGGCGVGKSTLATGHKKFFIFIAPTTVIIEQLASDDCQVIQAGVTPDFEKYKQFACTYDSLPRLTQAALDAGLNPYLIPIIVDECQHLLSDGFKGGRLDACMTEIRKFKSVTPTSATIPPLGIPYCEDLNRIVLTRPPRPIKWSYAIGSDIAMILRCLQQFFVVLYHLNNKKKIQVIVSYFEGLGYRVEYIDSDNKDEMMERGLANKRLPDADLYICTSVFNDGISVHEHAKNYRAIVSRESGQHLGPLECVQFFQRWRDNVPDHAYIMRKTDEFNDDIVFLWGTYEKEYIKAVEDAEKKAASDTALYYEMIKGYGSDSLDYSERCKRLLRKMFPCNEDSLVVFNEEKQIFEPNLRAIGQYVYETLQRTCNASRYMMEYWLGKHDFEFDGIIEIEQETELEKDLLKTSKSLKKADRQAMRDTITAFETYEDALDASKAELPTTYSQAVELLPFSEFAEGKEKGKEELRLEYRQALREKVKEAQITRKAAQIYVEHVQTLCATGTQFKDAVGKAKSDLADSTLTGQALKRLKYAKELQAIARGVRDSSLAKVADGAFVAEVLQSVTIGEPLVKENVDARFEHAFRHSEDARKRLTVKPRIPKREPTDEDIQQAVEKAAKAQWQKRKEFLDCFFDLKRKQRVIDGERQNVWIPIKSLY